MSLVFQCQVLRNMRKGHKPFTPYYSMEKIPSLYAAHQSVTPVLVVWKDHIVICAAVTASLLCGAKSGR